MTTRVIGFQPPDNEWKTKKAAYDACEAASIPIPEELYTYFNHEPPNDHGREIDITQATTPWHDDMREGIEIEIAKLPPNIKIIRFINSW